VVCAGVWRIVCTDGAEVFARSAHIKKVLFCFVSAMAAKKISLSDAGRYEFRGEKKFELRMADSVVKTNFVYDEIVLPQRRTHIKRLFTCCTSRSGHRYGRIGSRSRASNTLSSADAPDVDFCADAQVKLTNGITAYRLTEPQGNLSLAPEDKPLIVCLHDLSNCSYMWADAVDLLADCDQGPRARVLVLDFYGRGRSPWIGVPCTLEVFVLQIKELLDCKFFMFFFCLPFPFVPFANLPSSLLRNHSC